jgi:hypothetical protein
MARQGLRFGATNIVLNESFGRWRWWRGRRRRNCSTASVVQKINAQIAAPLRLSKKLPAQIVIVQKVKLEPCGRSLLTAIIAPAVVTGDFILNSGGALPLQLIFAEQRMSRWSIRWSSARRSITWSDRS